MAAEAAAAAALGAQPAEARRAEHLSAGACENACEEVVPTEVSDNRGGYKNVFANLGYQQPLVSNLYIIHKTK